MIIMNKLKKQILYDHIVFFDTRNTFIIHFQL
jgi:hypothetical protein